MPLCFFYFRFPPLDVCKYAFGAKNENFSSKYMDRRYAVCFTIPKNERYRRCAFCAPLSLHKFRRLKSVFLFLFSFSRLVVRMYASRLKTKISPPNFLAPDGCVPHFRLERIGLCVIAYEGITKKAKRQVFASLLFLFPFSPSRRM